MKISGALALILIFILAPHLKAQETDSLKNKIKWNQRKSFKVALMPAALSVIGIASLTAKEHTTFSKYSIQREFLKEVPGVKTSIDDQLRYIPVAMVYGLNLVGVKGKNKFVERSLLLTKSLVLQHLLVSTMKKGFNVERPCGGNFSFPSSHTARAFAAASFMHHEFGHKSIWYSVAGYSFAAATGVLRVANNHHWLPDVLIGAGLGMLSTNLVYLTHKYRFTRWMNNRKGKSITLLPTYSASTPGLYLNITF